MLDYRIKYIYIYIYIYICDGRYDVRRRSVEKAVMLLPGLEAPEGGNIRGIYGCLRVFVVGTSTVVVWAAFG